MNQRAGQHTGRLIQQRIHIKLLNAGANLNIQYTLDTDSGAPAANITLQAATLAP